VFELWRWRKCFCSECGWWRNNRLLWMHLNFYNFKQNIYEYNNCSSWWK
jgi:hypothetical protein